jgi:hypothetical protein
MFCTLIREMLGSELGWDTAILNEDFHGFPRCYQENAGIMP